ncbi:Hypothetical predicted protein [Lecanosticta acicola]|uniref:Uncharacterized protein n=1 Tax=Lecanosticta acicola TaxID=111012 RepID=A0AAI9EC23_9PEZI|nr:Hypothetical predicted protein [Lecanosticta acicola]
MAVERHWQAEVRLAPQGYRVAKQIGSETIVVEDVALFDTAAALDVVKEEAELVVGVRDSGAVPLDWTKIVVRTGIVKLLALVPIVVDMVIRVTVDVWAAATIVDVPVL